MNYKLVPFIVLAFIFVIALFFLQQTLKIDFEIIMLTQFAPTLAYVVTIVLVKDLYLPIKINLKKTIMLKTLFSVIVPLFLISITYFICKIMKSDIEISPNIPPLFYKIGLGIFIGAVGEEIGWRSFLQPTLEKKYSVFISSIITGLIWGLWHIQHYMQGPVFIFMYLLYLISVSIIITYLSKDTQYNIIISSSFHASMNISFIIYFNFISSDGKILLTVFTINSIVWVLCAIIIILLQKDYFFIKSRNK